MANLDMKKIIFQNATIQWPKLDQTYRWNQAAKKSEPCEQNASNAQWSCGFVLPTQEAVEIFKACQQHYNECKQRNPSMPKFQKVFGMKKLDNDLVQFTAKKNGVTRNGKSGVQPDLLMADLRPATDRKIYSGSVGNGIALAYPSTSPDGEGGISLLLSRIQLVKAIYAPPEEDFETLSTGTEIINSMSDDKAFALDGDDDLDAFGLPKLDDQKVDSLHDDIDDDIPF